MTEREEDPLELLTGAKSLVKRKGAKGINHFSYCDRATQTTVPPIRVRIRKRLIEIQSNEIIAFKIRLVTRDTDGSSSTCLVYCAHQCMDYSRRVSSRSCCTAAEDSATSIN